MAYQQALGWDLEGYSTGMVCWLLLACCCTDFHETKPNCIYQNEIHLIFFPSPLMFGLDVLRLEANS